MGGGGHRGGEPRWSGGGLSRPPGLGSLRIRESDGSVSFPPRARV